jgi:creatinine amidohydrolase
VNDPDLALAHCTYPEVAAHMADPRPKVAVIPVGSTEAHGPHLPLNTDSLIGEAVARRAAAELHRRGLVALHFPAIHYAVTDWAGSFTGSVSIAAATAIDLVLGTCSAARAMGFDRVVIFTAHLEPGHIASMREVARRYAEAHGQALVFPDTTRRALAARLTPEYQSGSCHAGQYETSLVLALRPELVRWDVARELPAHPVPLAQHIRDGARDFRECGMDRAYCGAPAAASAEEGQASLAVLAELVVEATMQSLADLPPGARVG